MRIKGIRHTCISVQNMPLMVEFYYKLGMNKMVRNRIERGKYFDHSTGLKNAEAHVVYLEAEDGSLLELIRLMTHDDDYSHVSFTVDGLEDALESPYNKVKAKFIKDPEGNLMECVEELSSQERGQNNPDDK